MKKLDIMSNKLLIVVISMVYFVFWLLGFLTERTVHVENVALLSIGIVVMVCLITSDNINNIIPFIVFVPFMFARPIDPLTIPVMIYAACGCLVIGLIIYLIRFKPKIKLGTLFFGLCALGLGMILGGINIKSDYRLYQFLLMFFIVIIFLVTYVFFISSSKKVEFTNIAFLITLLGVFISCQTIIYYLFDCNLIEAIELKLVKVGWGISNNIALMLLMTIPFTWYLCMKTNKYEFLFYLALLLIQSIVMIFTFSRGGIASFIVEVLTILILSFVLLRKEKTKLIKYFIILSIILLTISAVTVSIFIYNKEIFDKIITTLTSVDLETLNGRIEVYKIALSDLKDNLLFGKGFLYSMFIENNSVDEYMWGHNTIIQTLSTTGIFGTIGILYHFFEKYFVLFKKINFEKVILILAFAGSGLYGLMDVSYYFINYMIILIVLFVLCEPYFYNWQIKKIINK